MIYLRKRYSEINERGILLHTKGNINSGIEIVTTTSKTTSY